MAFTIPDESSAGHADQAEPKTLDFQALARRDTGVVSGCLVTAQGTPNMTLAVASGVVRVAGSNGTVTGGNVTVTANVSANPRYDAVVANASGVLSVIAGTAAAETTLDQPGVNLGTYAVLAIVYVTPGATALTSSEFVQKQQNQNPNAFHDEPHALNDTVVHTGPIDDAQIPSGIARDTEVTTAVSDHTAASDPHGDRAAAVADAGTQVSTHEAAADPHTGYQKESERAVASGYASLDSNALLPATQLPAPTASTFGGVKSLAATAGQFLTSIGTDGVPVKAVVDTSTLFSSSFALSGDISPTALAANVNDYNPTGLATASTLRLSTSDTTNRTITGLVGAADGRILFLHNLGPGTINLTDESTASSAANRFALTSDPLRLPVDGMVEIQYDSTSQRWRSTVTSPTTLDYDVAFTGDISPTALSANADDYNPTGLSVASTLRLSTNDANNRNITGLAGGADGRILVVHNLGAGGLNFLSENATSTAANRFSFTSGYLTLSANGALVLQYDATSQRWRAPGRSTLHITVPFSKQGAVVTTTEAAALRWYNDTGRVLTIDSVRASTVTAPTGANLIVDVNVDGTTIYTTQGNRPAIVAASNTILSTNPDILIVGIASYLSVNVDQIGSTVAGSDLTVQIALRAS